MVVVTVKLVPSQSPTLLVMLSASIVQPLALYTFNVHDFRDSIIEFQKETALRSRFLVLRFRQCDSTCQNC